MRGSEVSGDQFRDAALGAVDLPGVVVPTHHDVVVQGMRLHYVDWGTHGKPKIIFLHGGGLSAHTWDLVCAKLARDFHCYALDLRGHGNSEWSPVLDYSLAAHTADLNSFVEHIGGDRPVLVGHSLGGHAAMCYASQHSDHIAALVVIDTSPFFRGGRPLARIRDFMLGADDFSSFDDAVEYVRCHDPSRDPVKLKRTLRHSLRRCPDGRWVWKRDQRHLNDRYFAEALRELQSLLPLAGDIRCPTLLVRGDKGAVEAEDAEKFCSLVPNGRAATIEQAGHNVQSDNPAGLVDALRPFLEKAVEA